MKNKVHSNGQEPEEHRAQEIRPLQGMYENWFLDYASYVILERAVPAVTDGFKPVQRRIMHAMKELDDGRFNKVANIIGHTMQYHPHGDAAIGDAIVNMGQKDLLIETQGNWGDVRTGDRSAAPRYIEARLSKFALDVAFNPQTTEWQLSYDGRKKEPVALPVKFPLLLAQGVEGIAVGLSTRILPHNFIELIKASIDVLKGRSPKLYPDFPTGGMVDISEYNKGKRGGRIKVRAKIEAIDKKELIIKDIPYGITTTSLIESIVKANDKGKIKIKKVVDNTASEVEISITLANGVSPDITIDALYAFTDCEISISPNCCVIFDDKPHFLSVNEVLKLNTSQTVDLLTRELKIKKAELKEKLLFASLEKIFIENRIYREIEECESWEAVISTIDAGLEPFKSQFYREISQEDIVKLTEIKIKRISRFDSFKADELMRKLDEELSQVLYNLDHITDYTISFFEELLKKYGEGKQRKTELTSFDNIKVQAVVANNQKLYVNRKEGFIGYALKKDEFVAECSDIDDIIVIRKDGKCQVSRIADKVFMGKDILHAGVWKKNDERMVYNLVYLDGQSGRSFVKRFNVLAITRDKEYDLTKGHKNSRILYISANPNGEAETVTIKLTAGCKARKKIFDFDFSDLEIKGRGAGGNIVTRYPVRRVELKTAGVSTLKGVNMWYDSSIGRLNREGHGDMIGTFDGDDRILVIYKDGTYALTSYEVTNRYDADKVLHLSRLDPQAVVTAVYVDGASKSTMIKRFVIETQTLDKAYSFISEDKNSKLLLATLKPHPTLTLEVIKGKTKQRVTEVVNAEDMISIKGRKAMGNKLSTYQVKKVVMADTSEAKSTEVSTKSSKTGTPEKSVTQTSGKSEGKQANDQINPAKASKQKSKDGGYDIGSTIELDF